MLEENDKHQNEPKKAGNIMGLFKKSTPAPKPAEPEKKTSFSSPFAYLDEESKKKGEACACCSKNYRTADSILAKHSKSKETSGSKYHLR